MQSIEQSSLSRWWRVSGGLSVNLALDIRALRKTLADKASVIETVQGVGYRLRREQ
jgi:DNA-binding response OmpR family regulator